MLGFQSVEVNPVIFGIQNPRKIKSFSRRKKNAYLLPSWMKQFFLQPALALRECNHHSRQENFNILFGAMKERGVVCATEIGLEFFRTVGGLATPVYNVMTSGWDFYRSAIEGWQGFQTLVLSLTKAMKSGGRDFFQLSPQDQAMVACQFLGILAGAVTSAALPGGVGSLANSAAKTGRLLAKVMALSEHWTLRASNAAIETLAASKVPGEKLKHNFCLGQEAADYARQKSGLGGDTQAPR